MRDMSKLTQMKRGLISNASATFKDRRILVLDGARGKAFETFKAFLKVVNLFQFGFQNYFRK